MHLRRSIPVALISVCLAATLATAPMLAFGPSVIAVPGDTGQDLRADGIAGSGHAVVVSLDVVHDDGRFAALLWSTDLGTSWGVIPMADRPTRESQATICADHAVMLHTATSDDGDTWIVESEAAPFSGGSDTTREWTSTGIARHPDVACVADQELVGAWFERRDGG